MAQFSLHMIIFPVNPLPSTVLIQGQHIARFKLVISNDRKGQSCQANSGLTKTAALCKPVLSDIISPGIIWKMWNATHGYR